MTPLVFSCEACKEESVHTTQQWLDECESEVARLIGSRGLQMVRDFMYELQHIIHEHSP